jgi:hypothetical protein
VITASVDLVRTNAAVGDVIARVGREQWQAATPCSEWNVRDVVHHLVLMNRVFAALLDGGPMPERGADHLGDGCDDDVLLICLRDTRMLAAPSYRRKKTQCPPTLRFRPPNWPEPSNVSATTSIDFINGWFRRRSR